MYDTARRWLVVAAVVLVGLTSRPALAWVETSIQSDFVVVDAEPSGQALVTHELRLEVRGGPLQAYTLDGVDPGATPEGPGTVQRSDGRGANHDAPLLLHVGDDGTLRLEIDDERGLRHGRYLFRFGYRTDLRARELLQWEGPFVNLRWIGPRFADGVDSMKVLFRLPATDLAPRLPDVDVRGDTYGLDETAGGVFLAQLRRGTDKDELELTRPHIASGEPVVWRLRTGAKAFRAPPEAELVVRAPVGEEEQGAEPLATRRLAGLLAATIAALLVAFLTASKWRLAERQAESVKLELRPLLPLALSWRVLGAALLAAFSVLLAWRTVHVAWATGALGLGLLFVVQRAPRRGLRPRGPGDWRSLSVEEAFPSAGLSRRSARERWQRIGSFAVVLAATAAILLWVARAELAVLLVGFVALTTLALAGVRAEGNASHPTEAERAWLRAVLRRLERDPELRVELRARVTRLEPGHDELRLVVRPCCQASGLCSVEVALERGRFGFAPALMVRVAEGSAAQLAFGTVAVWQRGREETERVAIFRPVLPTRNLTVKLVRRLVAVAAVAARGQPSSKTPSTAPPAPTSLPSRRRMSGGSSLRTSKPGRPSSPAQQTRHA